MLMFGEVKSKGEPMKRLPDVGKFQANPVLSVLQLGQEYEIVSHINNEWSVLFGRLYVIFKSWNNSILKAFRRINTSELNDA